MSFYRDDSPIRFSDNVEADLSGAHARVYSIAEIQSRSNIFVFKDGASSSLTMGKLYGHTWKFPHRKNQHSATTAVEDEDLSDPDSDELLYQEYLSLIQGETHRWVGFVKWTGCPFSVPGDSGALVYASDDAAKIPLGIHMGALEEMFRSWECYFIEARLMGLQL